MSGAEEGLNAGLSNSVAQLVEKTFSGLISSSKDGFNLARSSFGIGFKKYLESTYHRCIKVKTLISSSEPILLSEAYEPAVLVSEDKAMAIDVFYSKIGKTENFALITAMLGAGKSFSMKYLYSKFFFGYEKDSNTNFYRVTPNSIRAARFDRSYCSTIKSIYGIH
ncbi:hypothetical protein [Rhizobium sp.]|uniref:hypothetical protein n=1 Tax=Rhizobium sp. TaxID=391 RepID=UPI0028AC627C